MTIIIIIIMIYAKPLACRKAPKTQAATVQTAALFNDVDECLLSTTIIEFYLIWLLPAGGTGIVGRPGEQGPTGIYLIF